MKDWKERIRMALFILLILLAVASMIYLVIVRLAYLVKQ